MKLLKKFGSFSAALVVSLSTLMAVVVPQAHATVYTCVWTGAASGTWNTSGNWSGCNSTVPQTGDIISFNLATPGVNDQISNNDIVGLSVSGLILTGAGSTNKSYDITGNKFTLAGPITQSQTSGLLFIGTDVDLGASITYAGTTNGLVFGINSDHTKTLDLKTYTLTQNLTGLSCYKYWTINSRLKSASGAIVVTGGALNLNAVANSFTGTVTVNGDGLALGADALGATGPITMNGASQLAFVDSTGTTYTSPVTMNSTGDPAINATGSTPFACSGVGPPSVTSTLSGSLTLSHATIFNGSNNLNVTGTFTASGNALTTKSGSTGSITTSAGVVAAPVETTTIAADDVQATKYENVANNQTLIIDGTRGDVSVGVGGKVKGTGTVKSLNTGGTSSIVAPGHSPGTLTVVESLDMQSGGTYELEIKNKDSYDQIKAGTVHLGSNVAILSPSLVTGYAVNASDTFTIVDNTGNAAIDGTFKDLAEGATFRIGDGVFKITYVGGTGNDIVLSVVTVPKVGNTGFMLIMSNPYTVAFATVAITAGAYFLSRRYAVAKIK